MSDTPRTDAWKARYPEADVIDFNKFEELERENAALSAQVAELRKDAERLTNAIGSSACPECSGINCHIIPCSIFEIVKKYRIDAAKESVNE